MLEHKVMIEDYFGRENPEAVVRHTTRSCSGRGHETPICSDLLNSVRVFVCVSGGRHVPRIRPRGGAEV